VEKSSYQLLSALFNRPRLVSRIIKGRFKGVLCSPMIHGTALVGALVVTMLGGSVVLLTGKSFDAAELWETVERMGREAAGTEVMAMMIVGDAFAVPMVEELERKQYDTSALNLIFSSGVLWSPEMKKKLLEYIPQVILQDVLGATEGLTSGYATTSTHKEIPRATFKVKHKGPFPVKVMNEETGADVEPGSGEVGILAIGGHIPVGYWKDPEKTAKVFRTIGGRRYNVYGDMCTVDNEGFVHLIGRGSECINTGGEKVYPEEVEETIHDHPKVEDVAVIGTQHPRWGEAVTAVVVLKKGEAVTQEEIIDFCKGKIADYKKPKRVVFLPSLDRQPSGKKEYKLIKKKAGEALGTE
jgi:fatty-acyl-CoA synthase